MNKKTSLISKAAVIAKERGFIAREDGVILRPDGEEVYLKRVGKDRRYLAFNVTVDKKLVTVPVHQFVACFLDEEKFLINGIHVCHKDDNPDNNTFSNIYCGSPKENMADRKRNRTLRSAKRNALAI